MILSRTLFTSQHRLKGENGLEIRALRYALLNLFGSLYIHVSQVHAEERTVGLEQIHGKSALANKVALPDLDHATKLCNASPL